jgi:four helix bundle protein
MTEFQNTKQYDLEERTLKFAKRINVYVNNLPKIISNIENGKQLVRAGGSVGANYIEANEAVSKKDFILRIKICGKEIKESRYWLQLSVPNEEYKVEKEELIDEATQLMKIFGSILEKSK